MSPPTEVRGLYETPTLALNAFSLEKAIFENRAFLLERQTQPELIPHQPRLAPRCTCVTLNKPSHEDYLAPFIPPVCTWAQKPLRYSPLMTPLGSLPIEYLDDLEDSTTPEAENLPDDGNTHERLLYKVQAPTLLKFTFIVLCMWLLRSIHTWWMAKQSQLRFERLLASASFSDLVEAKGKSSSRARTKPPRRETQERPSVHHPQPSPKCPRSFITNLEAYIAKIRRKVHSLADEIWLWCQNKWRRQVKVLYDTRQKSIYLLRHISEYYTHHHHHLIQRLIASPAAAPQTEASRDAVGDASENPHTPHTARFSDVSLHVTGKEVKTSHRCESSRAPVVASAVSTTSRKSSSTSPQLKPLKSSTSSPVPNVAKDAPRRGVKEVRPPSSFPINLTALPAHIDSREATTNSPNVDGGPTVARLSKMDGPLSAPRLCRLQAAVLCIESKENVPCGTQTAENAIDRVSVGVETTQIELKDSSVQTMPPRRPQWSIQKNESILLEAEAPTWTRIKMKGLRSRPARRRLVRGRRLLRRSDGPQDVYNGFLQRSWVAGSSSSTEVARRLFGESRITTSASPASISLAATAATEGIVTPYSTSTIPKTTCTTTPAISLLWVKPEEDEGIDSAKHSLEPPPGFESFPHATVSQTSSGYVRPQHFAANIDHEPFRSAPPLIQGAQGFIPRSHPVHNVFPGGRLLTSNRPYEPPVTGGPLPINVEASCGAAHIADLTAGVDLLRVGKR